MTNLVKVDPTTGQFIDPMFAVIIASAVSETIVRWVNNSTIPSFFSLFVVILGFLNLLLSWFGYHKSVNKRPIKGGARFLITVTLLPAYLMTIIMHGKPFLYIASAYAIIFFVWSIWEYLKFREYGEKNEKTRFFYLQFRPFNVIVYGTVIYLALSGDKDFIINKYVPKEHSETIAAGLIFFSILYLRLSKSAITEGTFTHKILSGINGYILGK